ncbi:MAG: PaaI family thioesterase [Firmicutes bacterium]|nr:PaaI family thioesterase [Bacillota bacterium]
MDKQPSSRSCFVCGRENDNGLHLEWYNDDESQRVVGTVTVPAKFNGYPGVVHGGIVAAILDETAGRAIMLNREFDNLMVTIKLEVTYRRPTPCGVPLTVTGWVDRRSGSRAQVAGEIRLPDGSLTATAKAHIMKPPPEFLGEWEKEKPFWRVYDD